MKASIIIINYNDKVRVSRAIESALSQTYEDIEVIVVDDGSDNETREIYKQYPNHYRHHINLIQLERDDKSKRTPSRARNEGIKKATGDYICFLDSDNYYSKDFIKECMKNTNDVMYVDWQIIGIENYDVKIDTVWDMRIPILENYLTKTHLDHQCLLINKDVLNKAGLYDERLPRSQDCDLIVRLMKVTKDWCYVPKRLFFFEKHEADQMKSVASLHGKMLWTLKNGIAWDFLVRRIINNPLMLLAVIQGYNDFCNNAEWKEDFEKSKYKSIITKFNDVLKGEISE